MNNIKVSIDRIIIEYTKVSMNFFNSYIMKNICDFYAVKPTIGKSGFRYKLYLKEYDGSYLHISYQPYNQGKSLSYSLWIETHPKYLERFRNILDALNIEAKEVNFVLCDVAYDIPYSINNVFIASNTGRKMNIFKGTKYFGDRKSSKDHGYCRVYDKKNEQKEKKNKEVAGELTRVEIVYRPDSKGRFDLLDLLKHPPDFNRYYTCRVITNTDLLKPERKAIIMAIQNELMTLDEFSPYQRKKIKEELSNQLTVDFNDLTGQNWEEILSDPIRLIYGRRLPF